MTILSLISVMPYILEKTKCKKKRVKGPCISTRMKSPGSWYLFQFTSNVGKVEGYREEEVSTIKFS